MNIDVSVVTPTFRRPAQVVEAVQSALAQQGVALDVLVLDDSPEKSAAAPLAAIEDARLRAVAHEPPSGGRPAKVRNAGWKQTQGRFLHFLDDDDRVPAGAYRRLAHALDANPSVGVSFGAVVPFGDDEAEVAKERAFFERARERARACRDLRLLQVAHLLFADTLLVNSACMIRRSCVERLCGYDETLPTFEDVDFYARAIREFGAVFVDEPVLERRVGPSLVHDLASGEPIARAYRQMHHGFRSSMGRPGFLAMKVAARTVLRWL